MNVETRQKIERRIVRRIVVDAIAAGYSVSVYDGGETTLRCSRDVAAIMRAVMTTDDDKLFFHRENETQSCGMVWLVYGNDGYDVICDYSANDTTESLLAGATELAERLEEQYG